jgi:CO/xanthine dehydrogenase FAD-binding subunit
LKAFNYIAPSSLKEVLALLDKFGKGAGLLAGGTDLLVQMNQKTAGPDPVIDLKKVPGLRGMESTSDNGLRLGPLTTVSEIESSRLVQKRFAILAKAASTIGSPQIRTRATIGGNISRAAPSADLVPPLLVLEATAKITGIKGEREERLERFFLGPGQTTLKEDEFLTEIRIPPLPENGCAVYIKQSRRRTMDLAIVGVAVLIATAPRGDLCTDARIALGSVGPIPFRATRAEKALQGNRLEASLIDECAEIAGREAKPISDVYGPEWFKRDLVRALVKRAIYALENLQRRNP